MVESPLRNTFFIQGALARRSVLCTYFGIWHFFYYSESLEALISQSHCSCQSSLNSNLSIGFSSWSLTSQTQTRLLAHCYPSWLFTYKFFVNKPKSLNLLLICIFCKI